METRIYAKSFHRILVCEGEPVSCCISPTKPNLIFAGTKDGGINVWDLQDTYLSRNNMHHISNDFIIKNQTVLWPSYSTNGMYSMNKSHGGAIIALIHLTRVSEQLHQHQQQYMSSAQLKLTAKMEDTQSVQISSIDETGIVQIWV